MKANHTYEHTFEVDAPRAVVAAFHFDPRNMKALTPPGTFIRFESVPDAMVDGASVTFRMQLGPFPVQWTAMFSDVSEAGFKDTQIAGPFARWVHTHTFEVIDAGRTRVVDHIDIELAEGGLQRMIGALMVSTLGVLFQYRKLRTRGLLGN